MLKLALSWSVTLGLLGLTLPGDPPPKDLPQFSDQIHVIGEAPFVEPVELGQPVHIVFSVGDLDIEAAEVSEVRAEIVTRCRKVDRDRCSRLRKRIRIEPRRTSRGLEVHMVGLSRRRLAKVGIEGRVIVPRWSPLSAKLGIGDVDIHAGIEDVNVQMGIGDLTVHAPEAHVGSVAVRTGIGDAGVSASRNSDSRRRMLIGAKARWAGEGDSEIVVRLKIGDAQVVLD